MHPSGRPEDHKHAGLSSWFTLPRQGLPEPGHRLSARKQQQALYPVVLVSGCTACPSNLFFIFPKWEGFLKSILKLKPHTYWEKTKTQLSKSQLICQSPAPLSSELKDEGWSEWGEGDWCDLRVNWDSRYFIQRGYTVYTLILAQGERGMWAGLCLVVRNWWN